MKSIYYDGTKLLSLKDINGKQPELYLCTTNRTGGKTTYFGRLLINRFLDKKEKFCLIYRFKYELSGVADKFFKDIGALFFPEKSMEEEAHARSLYYELFLDGESCGYAVSLNSADQLKKYSHVFSDVKRMLFDEFQSESGNYCGREIEKFLSIHTSIARGHGEQVRYVPVYMIGNPVTLLNPYYMELGIASRLRSDTRFLKGDGFVLEQGHVQTAADAQKESGFNRAFAANQYIAYSAESVYLNDNTAFIEKPTGRSRYIATLRYNNKDYAIREFPDAGLLYVDHNADNTHPVKITTTTEDHKVNYLMLSRASAYISAMRQYFENGSIRFHDLECKEAILSAFRI